MTTTEILYVVVSLLGITGVLLAEYMFPSKGLQVQTIKNSDGAKSVVIQR